MSFLMKNIACIDMEGVLIPELWPHIAEVTGITDLAITTREEPDYARLVNRRIELLRKNRLRLIDVQALIERVDPLPGALNFLTELRKQFHVVLVSDAFQEMILPLWEKLDQPELRCHWFTCDRAGYISKAHYSRRQGKHEVIDEFAANGHRTLAVGDAFNDLTMLRRASMGFLFCPSPQTLQAAVGISVARTYPEILTAVAADQRMAAS